MALLLALTSKRTVIGRARSMRAEPISSCRRFSSFADFAMSGYKFVTNWRMEAPVAAVWEEIHHSEHWPAWWSSVLAVAELRKGDDNGLGSVRRYTWRGALPYKLTFDMQTTRVEKHSRLEGIATGQLSGNGRWTFSSDGAFTNVRYD